MNTGIKHIEFWVSNLERSLVFYKQLFELIGWQPVDSNGFTNGETKIYFIEQTVGFVKNAGPRHICFFADSEAIVNKVGGWLENTNAFIIRGPMNYTYESKLAYTVDFKDLDGYILEVATKSV